MCGASWLTSRISSLTKNPDAVGEDMTDLAAIGLARYSPTTTPSQIAELVAEARRHGRS